MTPNPLPVVRSVRVRAVRVPMAQPHRTASGVVSESPLVLTEIVANDDTSGQSVVFTYTAAALQPTALLVQNLAPLIEGQPLAPTALVDSLAARLRLLGTQGLIGMALAALDMALWDALARSRGCALVELLGGTARPIPAYGAVGYDGIQGSAETAEGWAKRGFTGIKAKIGYPTVQEDIAVIKAMRAAVGPGMAIMVDYNQSLLPIEAIERMRLLDEEGLTWVEEPVHSHDFVGHALVAREARTPVQSGENWWGPLDVQHALDAQAVDYLMLDVMKIGGVTGWMRAAALAQGRGVPVSSHLWPEISAQLLCATPTACWLEYADWWNPVMQEPLVVTNGLAQPTTSPGSGVAWDWGAVERWAI